MMSVHFTPTDSSLILSLLLPLLLLGQEPAEPALDPSIVQAELNNGFRYFIKPMPGTGEKIRMKLIVEVGSMHETEEEFSMAHFLEHMPFVQTRNFDNIVKNDSLLKQVDMKTTDIRGITGGKHTLYFFDAPPGHSQALKTGIRFFQDIAAGGIRFEQADVDGERGALFQEFLFSASDKLYVDLKAASLLSTCIKKVYRTQAFKEHLNHFSINTLKGFYKKWYRPDRMSLIIVGDMQDPYQVENQVKQAFGAIAKPKNQVEELRCEKAYTKAPMQYKTLVDPHKTGETEKKEVEFHCFFRPNASAQLKLNKQEYTVMETLVFSLLKKHLKTAVKGYNIPYSVQISPVSANFVPAIKLVITTSKAQQQKAVQEVFAHIQEFRNTLSEAAFDKEKQALEQAWGSRPIHASNYWSKAIEKYITHNEPLPEHKFKWMQKQLHAFSWQLFKQKVDDYLPEQPQDIVVVHAPKTTYNKSEKKLRSWIKNTSAISLQKPKPVPKKLLTQAQQEALVPAGKQVAQQGAMHSKCYQLANGSTLVLKTFTPSPGRDQDNLIIHGFRQKGAASLPKHLQQAAQLAPQITKHAGVGAFDKFQRDAWLKSKGIVNGINLYIKPHESGFKAIVKPHQLETAFQLLYVYMTKPRWDKAAFLDWKTTQYQNYLAHKNAQGIKADFLDKRRALMGVTTHNPQASKRIKAVKQVKINQAKQAYKALLQNPKNLTLIISGNVQAESVLKLVNKYWATIAPPHSKSDLPTISVKAVNLPKRPITYYYKPSQALSNILLRQSYVQPLKNNNQVKDEIEAYLLSTILIHKLHDLRYKKKRSVYLAIARTAVNRQDGFRLVNFIIDVGPKDLKAVKADLDTIITQLKTKGISQSYFKEVMQAYVYPHYSKDYQGKHQQVQAQLYEHYRYGTPVTSYQEQQKIIQSLDASKVPEIAKKYLDKKYLMEFIASDEK